MRSSVARVCLLPEVIGRRHGRWEANVRLNGTTGAFVLALRRLEGRQGCMRDETRSTALPGTHYRLVYSMACATRAYTSEASLQELLPLLERTWCRLRSVRDRPCLIRRCSYLLVFGTAVQCRTWSARGHRLVQLTACVVPIDIWHGFQCRTWSARDHRLVQFTAYVVPIDIWRAAPCQMPCGTADDPHARVPNVVIGTTDVW